MEARAVPRQHGRPPKLTEPEALSPKRKCAPKAEKRIAGVAESTLDCAALDRYVRSNRRPSDAASTATAESYASLSTAASTAAGEQQAAARKARAALARACAGRDIARLRAAVSEGDAAGIDPEELAAAAIACLEAIVEEENGTYNSSADTEERSSKSKPFINAEKSCGYPGSVAVGSAPSLSFDYPSNAAKSDDKGSLDRRRPQSLKDSEEGCNASHFVQRPSLMPEPHPEPVTATPGVDCRQIAKELRDGKPEWPSEETADAAFATDEMKEAQQLVQRMMTPCSPGSSAVDARTPSASSTAGSPQRRKKTSWPTEQPGPQTDATLRVISPSLSPSRRSRAKCAAAAALQAEAMFRGASIGPSTPSASASVSPRRRRSGDAISATETSSRYCFGGSSTCSSPQKARDRSCRTMPHDATTPESASPSRRLPLAAELVTRSSPEAGATSTSPIRRRKDEKIILECLPTRAATLLDCQSSSPKKRSNGRPTAAEVIARCAAETPETVDEAFIQRVSMDSSGDSSSSSPRRRRFGNKSAPSADSQRVGDESLDLLAPRLLPINGRVPWFPGKYS